MKVVDVTHGNDDDIKVIYNFDIDNSGKTISTLSLDSDRLVIDNGSADIQLTSGNDQVLITVLENLIAASETIIEHLDPNYFKDTPETLLME